MSCPKPDSLRSRIKPVDETAEAAPAETSGEKTETPATEERGDSLLSKFDRSRPKIRERTAPAPPAIRREQREITALHKRFDKIEALLDSAFISTNLDYASHPAFQQLVHTGIGTSVIAGWFSEIIKQGIDPYEQNEIFMNKLSGIIRDALSGSASGTPEKYLLFTGPSGAGKTNLVMKLCLHPEFLADKKLAVVSLLPQGDKSGYYYTILEPFCRDHTIPYFQVRSGAEVTRMQQEWEEYDHILIDTPSISTEQNHSFREYWKIRQLLASLTPLEVHYVVNASMNRYYFQNSTAANHPLQPDYVAITHLDEVSQWGPVIPFLKQMGCSARYISQGDDLPGSLNEFDPTWFARKVLQDS
jgi:flagellar biosynthesis GTPase FlhF